jgi:hypothetical protein
METPLSKPHHQVLLPKNKSKKKIKKKGKISGDFQGEMQRKS